MPNNETKVLDEDGAILLTSNIKTLADATYPANATVASPYNSSISYIVGSYCLHNGLLYKCNTAIPVGGEQWIPAHWDQVSLGNELALDRKLQFTDVVVNNTAFVPDTTYIDFSFRAAVTLTGVTASMYPEVVFDTVDAVSGLFAPTVLSYNGGIYIYAKEQPSTSITIPSIVCWIRGVALDSAGSLNIADEIASIEDHIDNIEDTIDSIEDNIDSIEDDITTIQNSAFKMTLVWTNASPTTAFAAQTISINLNDYEAVIIFARSFPISGNTTTWYLYDSIILKNTRGGLFPASVTANNIGNRLATVSNDGINFEGGYWAGNANNDYAVPYYIYGLKGVITT